MAGGSRRIVGGGPKNDGTGLPTLRSGASPSPAGEGFLRASGNSSTNVTAHDDTNHTYVSGASSSMFSPSAPWEPKVREPEIRNKPLRRLVLRPIELVERPGRRRSWPGARADALARPPSPVIDAAAASTSKAARRGRRLRALAPFESGWLATAMRFCLSLLCVGGAGLFVGRDAYATFNAVTTNSGNSFSTGTLYMDNAGTNACTHVTAGDCGTISLSSNTGMTAGSIANGTIKMTNSGSVPATVTLTASRDGATTAGFDADLNLTIYDNTTGTCVYGHASLPYSGPCDTIAGLSAQAANDAFPSSSTSLGPLTLPATPPNGNNWQMGEAHTLTVTVEVINNTVPNNAQGVLDLSWTGTSLTGTAR